MKLIEVVALLAAAALTFLNYTCLRSRRCQAVSARRIARSLELAIRADAARACPARPTMVLAPHAQDFA